jgi:hypothetical protein
MSLIAKLAVLALLMLGLVVAEAATDALHLRLPYYLIGQCVIALVPMVYLMFATLPKADRALRLAFITASALFITLSASAELIAINERFWGFYQGIDPLSALKMGDIPIEEFLFYPLYLNLPMLMYLYLAKVMPGPADVKPTTPAQKKLIRVVGTVLAVAGLALFANALLHTQPPHDWTKLPSPDASGALRFDDGPAQHGWTVVQLLGLAGICFVYASARDRIHHRRLAITLAVYAVIAFYTELMACGRGWWVWNREQVVGIFTWVLPLESYVMYFTGAIFPVVALEALRPFFAPELKEHGAPGAAPAPSDG